MSIINRLGAAMSAAYNAGRAAWADPLSQDRALSLEARNDEYGNAWLYYTNAMFSPELGAWDAYLSARGLYKHTRLIYNPIPLIVTFYEDNIFAPADESAVLDDGTQLITNVFDQTPDELKAAIAQLDQWGNWQSEAVRLARFGGVTGNVLVEIEDDVDKQRVYHSIQWPTRVKSLMLDRVGNVQAYELQYQVQDGDTRYTYRKVVTKESFSYFRDDRPFIPEGKTAEVEPNPYSFVPAIWIRHINDGSDSGRPAFGNIGKVNEVNSLASHTHDHIHKSIEAHKIIATDGEIKPIIGGSGEVNKAGQGYIKPYDPRLQWMVLKTPAGASVLDLAGVLKLAEADPYLERALKSFVSDNPELQAGEVIQQNSQLSGAALERMLAPAQKKLDRACAEYFTQVIKLRQMQVAIAGWRISVGDWSQRSGAQAKFAPYGLDSYAAGDLNFGIKRSLLIEATEAENEDLMLKKATRATTLEPIVDEQEALRVAGYSEQEAVDIAARRRTTDVIPTEVQ